MPQPFVTTPSFSSVTQNSSPETDALTEALVTLDASREFDRFLDELAQRMADEPDHTPLPLFAEARHTPLAPDGTAAFSGERGALYTAFAFDEEEPGNCLACGLETQWPVLCASCLERLEEVDPELACPFYVADARCAADCENGLKSSGCGGLLGACHHPDLLSGRPLAKRSEGRHEG